MNTESISESKGNPVPVSQYLAWVIVVLGGVLAAATWYLRPEKAAAPITALLLLGCMTLALSSSGSAREDGKPPRPIHDSIRSGIIFGGLMLVCSLGAHLVTALGGADGRDFSWRATMAIVGASLVFTGNTIPKTLAPLPVSPTDAARVQSLQRLAGWIWVLAGLTLSVAWLALPIRVADPVTTLVVPAAMLLSITVMFRLRRTRQTAA